MPPDSRPRARATATGSAELLDRVLDRYREALGNQELQPTDDFFFAGGHSSLAVDIAAALEEDLGTVVPVAEIFIYPTPAEIAELLAVRIGEGAADG